MSTRRILFWVVHAVAVCIFLFLFAYLLFSFLHPDGSRFELTQEVGVFRPIIAALFISALFAALFASPLYLLAWVGGRLLGRFEA